MLLWSERPGEPGLMSTRATLEEQVFTEVKRLCCAGLDGMTLLRTTAEALRRAIPIDAYCMYKIDPPSRLITQGAQKGIGGKKEARLFFENIYFEDYASGYNRLARSRDPVSLLSEVTGGRLERSIRYQEVTGPLGLGYQVSLDSTVGREIWGGMDLFRERDRPDFDPREVVLLRRISPHLGAGLKAAMLRLRAAAEPDGDGVPGVLTLNREGQVVQHTPAAERWLREVEDLGPDWREGDGLPAAVWMIVGALKRSLGPENAREKAGVPRLRIRARSGHWLTLYGSLSEPVPGQPAQTVIVIAPSRPEEVAWIDAAAYGLSPREEEVAKLVVRGLSTRQISRMLFISEYTVQNHVSNACEKVGVRSRGELVRRLFLDNLCPSLSG